MTRKNPAAKPQFSLLHYKNEFVARIAGTDQKTLAAWAIDDVEWRT